jgi:hypothetical protein
VTWDAARACAALLALAALARAARAAEPAAATTDDAAASVPLPAPSATPAGPTPSTAASASPPQAPAAPASRWDYAFLPLVFYAPETSLGLAFGVGVYDDTPSPPDKPRRDDNASLIFQGTLKKQFLIGLSGVKYWGGGRGQATEDISLVHFPNVFWGVGNDTPESARELFAQSLAVSRTSVAWRLPGEIYIGGGATAGWYRTTSDTPGGSVDAYAATVPARGPAIGVGPVLRHDTRDDAIGAHHGSLTTLTATFFPSFLGSTYHFQVYEIDQRTFLVLDGGGRAVLAMEAYGIYSPGTVPIAELPALGGSTRLRGYFQGRFRDHLYLMAQAECRIRVVGRWSVAPFAGVGNVFSSPSAVSSDRTKAAAGLAVRFRVKAERDLNVHLDVAKSPISSGVYLNIGEAF